MENQQKINGSLKNHWFQLEDQELALKKVMLLLNLCGYFGAMLWKTIQ